MIRVDVQPELLRWARDRAGLDARALTVRFPKLPEWEAGDLQPTLRQLESYARATHAPVGYFFLPRPPEEPLPIPDFRTIGDRAVARPGADLLDTLYACQARQAWYRDEALVTGQRPLPFIGSMDLSIRPERAAEQLRLTLGFSVQARRECPSWAEALRLFVAQADELGVLVMVSGVVGSNNNRGLDPEEFRGFALVDALAPLVFINGADSKSAQMFTLAHELAHLWLGQSALSDAGVEGAGRPQHGADVERWCNQVAAELLVPLPVFVAALRDGELLEEALRRLAREFKVSTLVVLRRMLDAGRLSRDAFWQAFRAEQARLAAIQATSSGGGDFYRTTTARVGKRFARSLVESTLEGRTLYRDAFQMLGIAKTGTFNELGRSLGLPT
ncbi:ImmA/IrrE family metallo-endopeptidase [Xanthomonas translucens]|uniref:IrrE N-terminal-like domain-containing protein n=1 Tax=Xanthomonas translucens pv. translucens DSM 18974 TaxID=1261556 RepID=A0A1C3TRN2_XANCT|nr:ImmA/IrrE family metallo-endopeptidase [Xanthomonas translucens]MCC8446694.1 ImmA/IrrE family metallo-endopeptidase [Xanthomonas translucens pv. translucens]MCT8286926.1 ImmA/IrrE family metallo-endopeptidase [Xanthomonas translucens pv. translucens]MCT8304584.1 ImmA/IrrE family metallo-endopeptidase [Xanthomonas translucens pv. translucens]QEO25617.1 ImmA/IrrE family metallo-endopeptidase [Xanthomonas translucens pv. undulosa]QSQ31725.1 ImmA/IrrE family metallo-endopeptidase [Xanthomonas t